MKPKPPVSQNVPLSRNSIIAEVIQLRRSHTGASGPYSNTTGVLVRRGQLDSGTCTERHHTKRQADQAMYLQAKEPQYCLQTCRRWGTAWDGVSLMALGEPACPRFDFTLSVSSAETTHSYCLSLSVCGAYYGSPSKRTQGLNLCLQYLLTWSLVSPCRGWKASPVTPPQGPW